MDGDIRAPRSVADVFGEFFFPAVRTRAAGLDDDSRHRYGYCNGNPICCAVTLVVHTASRKLLDRDQDRPNLGAGYCRAMAMRIASSGETR
jgi:hypothetical protein